MDYIRHVGDPVAACGVNCVLYKHYWITLLIFVPIGAMVVGTSKYLGNYWHILNNVTAWYTSWDAEIWFLFPYCLLALNSRLIFKMMDTSKAWLYLSASLFISLFCQYCLSRYGAAYLYSHHLAHIPFIYFTLLFSFILGAAMAKYNVVENCKDFIGGAKIGCC